MKSRYSQQLRTRGKSWRYGRPVSNDTWANAFRFTLLNSAAFLALSLAVWFLEFNNIAVSAGVALVFFLGSFAGFLMMIRAGGGLAAVSFFVLGTGIFFGFGTF